MSKNEMVMKNESSNNTCFFCEGSKDLKPFKNFYICQGCISDASQINEEEE